MKLKELIILACILFVGQTMKAQNPSLQVDGYLRLAPPNGVNINLVPGIIHYDDVEGVFKGYNGSKWVNLSLSAHKDLNSCPDPNADTQVPVPRCLTSMTVGLGQGGNSTIYVEDFDMGSTDNCGYYSVSFSPTEAISHMSLTCADLGTRQITLHFKDMKANSNFCAVLINVQDNTSQCPDIP